MQASPRYGDGAFHNTRPVSPGLKKGTAASTMWKFFVGGERRVPPAPLPSQSPLPGWARPVETGLRATWLGHSTVLLEVDGFRVLTDPVWGERASPTTIAGPKRFQPVPVAISDLPELDAVIVSHDHYDHLDFPSILELAKRDVPFFTSLGVGAHLESWGIAEDRITELDWWENARLTRPGGELFITAAPSQHFSGRSVGGRNLTLWSSFVVRGKEHAVFFSGDTGLTPEYEEIRAKLGPFDLVMLEVGAFHPAWGDIHLGPENALEALSLLGGGAFLPVHWGTFNLAIHAWDEPAEDLIKLAPSKNTHLVMPVLGEPVEPTRVQGVTPWWREIANLERERCGDKVEDAAQTPTGEPLDWPID
ncbi:MAG TPA: MBL fold metallo-hydrolase [Polyangiaceae bacterium]|jgi:L-ascorbate metabolism protein UlaG (beta-lactamase superfamily)